MYSGMCIIWIENKIGPEGGRVLSELIACNSVLTFLNVNGEYQNQKNRMRNQFKKSDYK